MGNAHAGANYYIQIIHSESSIIMRLAVVRVKGRTVQGVPERMGNAHAGGKYYIAITHYRTFYHNETHV